MPVSAAKGVFMLLKNILGIILNRAQQLALQQDANVHL